MLATPLRAAVLLPADIVVVRIYEGSKTTVIITRGEGKSEKLEIDNGLTDKKLIQGSEGYYKVFERLYSEGYTLQNSFITTFSPSISFTTLLFTKAR